MAGILRHSTRHGGRLTAARPARPDARPVRHDALNWSTALSLRNRPLPACSVRPARLVLDWSGPLLHGVFYKAVYRPAILRANRLAGRAVLAPAQTFHALRHSYASLCDAAGIPTVKVSRFIGHSKPSTTETIYMHLFADDHADEIAALGGLASPDRGATYVVRLRR